MCFSCQKQTEKHETFEAPSAAVGYPQFFAILQGKKHCLSPVGGWLGGWLVGWRAGWLAGLAGWAGWLGWLGGLAGCVGWVGWLGWLAGLENWFRYWKNPLLSFSPLSSPSLFPLSPISSLTPFPLFQKQQFSTSPACIQ